MEPPTAASDVPVGRIAGAFGVGGELKCDPTGAGRTLLSAGARFTSTVGGEPVTVRIVAVRPHKGRLLIRIDGVDDRNAAEAYAGAILHAARERIELAPGEYLDEDLVGCRVFGADGRDYGSVEAVEHFPASDMLVVNATMVPMVAAHVREIDVAARRIVIDPPAGLFEA
ncbi:MAG TPA: ribosome maturation factor RimM [Candidatus Tumulicola sp.]|jgi:16S rRNA processing protein RimM